MIYLVRHGETEFNRERRLQGHVDSALTALGQQGVEPGGLEDLAEGLASVLDGQDV